MSDRPDEKRTPLSRREVVSTGIAAVAGFGLGRVAAAKSTAPAEAASPAAAPVAAPAAVPGAPYNPRTHLAMPTRNLGKTGYQVGLFSLGGQATIEQPDREQEAIALVERALDLGVNYLDTAARYGGDAQWSQKYIGQVMKRRRNEVFLASKTHDRGYDGSMRLLEESLRQIQTDRLDLWQLHNVRNASDIERIFAPNGAIKALVEAREQGLVRFVGITGHADPHVLAEGLRRFAFDTILLAVNAADRHHLSFIEHLLPLALEQQLGIIAMKIPARGRILDSWQPQGGDRYGSTRPGTIGIREAFAYVYSLPVSTAIVGCDTIAQLEENVAIAKAFTPLNPDQLAALEAKTEAIHRQALFFRDWDRA